jgi:hypothetical protein
MGGTFFSSFTHFHTRLRSMHYAFMGHVSTFVFSFIYYFFVPWFFWFAKKKRSEGVMTRWQPWKYQTDTLEDLQKQY